MHERQGQSRSQSLTEMRKAAVLSVRHPGSRGITDAGGLGVQAFDCSAGQQAMDALSLGAAFPAGADASAVLLPGLPVVAGAPGQQAAQQLHAGAAADGAQQAAGVSMPFLTQDAQQTAAGAALPSFLLMPNWPRPEVRTRLSVGLGVPLGASCV